MRDRIRALLTSIQSDHAQNRPSSPREVFVYLIEVWAALGLFWRGTCHAVAYSALHDGEDIHPLQMEWGLVPGLAVQQDALGREPSRQDAQTIQSVTSIVTAIVLFGLLLGNDVPLSVLLAVGPSLVVTAGDPILGLIHDYRTNSQPTTSP